MMVEKPLSLQRTFVGLSYHKETNIMSGGYFDYKDKDLNYLHGMVAEEIANHS